MTHLIPAPTYASGEQAYLNECAPAGFAGPTLVAHDLLCMAVNPNTVCFEQHPVRAQALTDLPSEADVAGSLRTSGLLSEIVIETGGFQPNSGRLSGACPREGLMSMSSGRRRRQLTPEEKWEVFLEVAAQQLTQRDAARKWAWTCR